MNIVDKVYGAGRIKYVFLDVDGTLVHYNKGSFGSSWDALAFSLGVFEQTNLLTKKYYPQKNKHEEWARKEVSLFEGKSVLLAQKHLYPIPYSLGVKEFAEKSKGKFIRGILSTSVDVVAEKITKELDLDFCICNVLGRENGRFNGKLDYNVPLWKKDIVLKNFCEKNEFKLKNIAFVGDHENDIPCFEIVGLPIAFNPKKLEVSKKAKGIISDFNDLNKILGIY